MKKLFTTVAAVLLGLSIQAFSSNVSVDIQTKKPVASVSNDMYRIFFEDINFGADGGLYGEMVKNRSFEFPQSLMGWNIFGNVGLDTKGCPFEKNPHYVKGDYLLSLTSLKKENLKEKVKKILFSEE